MNQPITAENLTGEQIAKLAKLVQERDTIDKDLQTKQARRLTLSQEIEAILSGKAPEGAKLTPTGANGTSAHRNGNSHTPSRTKKAGKKAASKKPAASSAKSAPKSDAKRVPNLFKGQRRTKPGKKGAHRAAHGTVEETIMAALKKAGAKGVTIGGLCKEFGLKEDTVSKWFGANLQRSGIERVKRGLYALGKKEDAPKADTKADTTAASA